MDNEEDNMVQEYFQYVMDTNELQAPTNWRDALTLYNQLLHVAQGP